MRCFWLAAIFIALTPQLASAQFDDEKRPDFGDDAAKDDAFDKGRPAAIVDTLSSDLVESRRVTRMQVLTHATFSDADSVFSDSAAFAMEARVDVALTDTFSLSAVAPLGFASGAGTSDVFFGNLGIGASIGFEASPEFRLGFGADIGLPTSPGLPDDLFVASARSVVGSLHAYDVHLFVPQLASLRIRGHGRLKVDAITLEVDTGFSNGFTIGDNSAFVVMMSGKVRAAGRFGAVEPFFEMGGAAQIAGNGRIRPPFLLGPGVRIHAGEFFRPAFSMMFNFVESNVLMFGIDLVGTVIPTEGGSQERLEQDDVLDF